MGSEQRTQRTNMMKNVYLKFLDLKLSYANHFATKSCAGGGHTRRCFVYFTSWPLWQGDSLDCSTAEPWYGFENDWRFQKEDPIEGGSGFICHSVFEKQNPTIAFLKSLLSRIWILLHCCEIRSNFTPFGILFVWKSSHFSLDQVWRCLGLAEGGFTAAGGSRCHPCCCGRRCWHSQGGERRGRSFGVKLLNW